MVQKSALWGPTMRRVAAGIIVALIGIGAVAVGFARTSAEDVMSRGAAVPGEIVAISSGGVEIEFSLAQERMRAMARPADRTSFEVGEFVWVSVLREDPSHIVIHDTEEATSWTVTGLLVSGGVAVIVGVGIMLMHLVSTPGAGTYSEFTWTWERHGGA